MVGHGFTSLKHALWVQVYSRRCKRTSVLGRHANKPQTLYRESHMRREGRDIRLHSRSTRCCFWSIKVRGQAHGFPKGLLWDDWCRRPKRYRWHGRRKGSSRNILSFSFFFFPQSSSLFQFSIRFLHEGPGYSHVCFETFRYNACFWKGWLLIY